jgi:hypothetical protein
MKFILAIIAVAMWGAAYNLAGQVTSAQRDLAAIERDLKDAQAALAERSGRECCRPQRTDYAGRAIR